MRRLVSCKGASLGLPLKTQFTAGDGRPGFSHLVYPLIALRNLIAVSMPP